MLAAYIWLKNDVISHMVWQPHWFQGKYEKYMYILLRIQRWRDSHPTLGATLTTAVSEVYNAGWLGPAFGSRVFNRDTNVILDLTSWGNRPRLQTGFVRCRAFSAIL